MIRVHVAARSHIYAAMHVHAFAHIHTPAPDITFQHNIAAANVAGVGFDLCLPQMLFVSDQHGQVHIVASIGCVASGCR